MKLICVAPSLSIVSVVLCRYFSLSCSGLMIIKFRNFLRLLLLQLNFSRRTYIKFAFFLYSFLSWSLKMVTIIFINLRRLNLVKLLIVLISDYVYSSFKTQFK